MHASSLVVTAETGAIVKWVHTLKPAMTQQRPKYDVCA